MSKRPCISTTIAIERDGGEIELEVFGNICPGSPGRFYGPPEYCYPPEEAEAEITSIRYNGIPWNDELSDSEEQLAKAALLSEFEDDDSFEEEDYDDE